MTTAATNPWVDREAFMLGMETGQSHRFRNIYSGGIEHRLATEPERESYRVGYETGWSEVDNATGSRPPRTNHDHLEFTLERFSLGRLVRGAEAARVRVNFPDGTVDYLWMSAKDVLENRKNFGPSPGLAEAASRYFLHNRHRI